MFEDDLVDREHHRCCQEEIFLLSSLGSLLETNSIVYSYRTPVLNIKLAGIKRIR